MLTLPVVAEGLLVPAGLPVLKHTHRKKRGDYRQTDRQKVRLNFSPAQRRRSDRRTRSRYRTPADHTRLCWTDTPSLLVDTKHTHTHSPGELASTLAVSTQRWKWRCGHLTSGAALSVCTLSTGLQLTGLILTAGVLLTLLNTHTHTMNK